MKPSHEQVKLQPNWKAAPTADQLRHDMDMANSKHSKMVAKVAELQTLLVSTRYRMYGSRTQTFEEGSCIGWRQSNGWLCDNA